MKQPTTYAEQLKRDQLKQELDLQKQNAALYKETSDPRLKATEKRVSDLEAQVAALSKTKK